MNRDVCRAFAAAAMLAVAPASAAMIDIHAIDEQGVGQRLGSVTAGNSAEGLVLNVQLSGLPPGEHGFHVHENPDCGPKEQDGKFVAGGAAGGHYDPQNTERHQGPRGEGHLGDLPALRADSDGNIAATIVAPRLELADIHGRSLMIHSGGDNYADEPELLGGGGARIACGVVE